MDGSTFSREKLSVEFHRVFTAQQIGSYKPSIKNFHYLLEQLDVPKEQILHVAQSKFHDIVPSHSLGFATVWVNRREEGGAAPLAGVTPDREVQSLAELADLVDFYTESKFRIRDSSLNIV